MSKHLSLQDQTTEFLLYTAPNGAIKVEVVLSNETIWLTQERMAELFGVQRPAITKHLKNIFESNELQEEVVCSILEHTTAHGAIEGKTQTSKSKYYNLDAVISVAHPGMKGFSRTCLFAMRQFYAFFSPQFEVVPQPVGQMPWRHVGTQAFSDRACGA
ncbi:hypothetical protein A1353_16060 [Methylomonas methanica]|uniref:Uncharacterized protein n=1 Tax=Methylomonas methanica TaxID=421 RepID=A0A177M9A1_METMH|nr:DUF1016 N-terminal domain-containing protein [Methylomonas methanica]OAI02308.1 hypothetical protein A1353_16060 [Methylomonas methanica]